MLAPDWIAAAASLANSVALGYLIHRGRGARKNGAAVTFASSSGAPAPAPPPPIGYPECTTCHRPTARFTLTEAGPICANCQPLA